MSNRPATDKQVSFIRTLLAERDYAATVPAPEVLTAAEASKHITALLAAPRKAQAQGTTSEAAKPGYYVRQSDQAVFVVVNNREKTRTYAKVLVLGNGRARWDYAPGVGRTLAGFEPLTATEAGRLGHLHGICIICCKALTDPVSVKQGIGPVCIKRLH